MRFPKLSQFFHRRSKSDTALALPPHRPREPKSTTRRPASSSFLDHLVLVDSPSAPQTLFSDVLVSISGEPLSLADPPPVVPLQFVNHIQPPSESSQYSLDTSSPPLVSALRQCIQELESALQLQVNENKRIAALEVELEAERIALQECREANDLLSGDIAGLQADVMHARGELYAALNNQLAGEPSRLAALEAENDRLRKFVSCVTTGALEQASQQVIQGEDPEEAIVQAIKEAMKNPDSVWRRLLEPIVGQRAPEDYVAQVNCTLKARREARDWRKKTKFWKRHANEDGRHKDTVTPSVSQLSDIVDELPAGRKKVVEDMMEKLKEGTLPLKVERTSTIPEAPTIERIEQQLSFKVSSSSQFLGPPSMIMPIPLTPIAEAPSEYERSPVPAREDRSLPPSPPSLPRRRLSLPTAPSISIEVTPYSNLAPLASITFRESHSIKSLTSKRDSFTSLNFTGRRNSMSSLRVLSPSASISTQDSHASQKSLRRRAKILGVSLSRRSLDITASRRRSKSQARAPTTEPEALIASATISQPSLSFPASLAELASVAASAAEVERSTGDIPTPRADSCLGLDGPGFLGSDDSTPRGSLLATTRSQGTASVPPPTTIPVSIPVPSSSSSSSKTLLTQDRTLTPKKPHLRIISPTASSPTGNRSPGISPNTTPTKKSRLPVFKMAGSIPRTIKRLSISRPVLVDTTNAAASVDPKPTASGFSMSMKGKGSPTRVRPGGDNFIAYRDREGFASKKVGKSGKADIGKAKLQNSPAAKSSRRLSGMRFGAGGGTGLKNAKRLVA